MDITHTHTHTHTHTCIILGRNWARGRGNKQMRWSPAYQVLIFYCQRFFPKPSVLSTGIDWVKHIESQILCFGSGNICRSSSILINSHSIIFNLRSQVGWGLSRISYAPILLEPNGEGRGEKMETWGFCRRLQWSWLLCCEDKRVKWHFWLYE